MPNPNLQLTVPRHLWDAMAEACSPAFADSYLSGASAGPDTLLPYTVTGWERLKNNRSAMQVLTDFKLKLVKPPPFGSR